MAVGFFGKLLFKKGASKVSPTITKVEPNVPKTKGEKLKRDLKLAVRKSKTAGVKLDNTIFRIKQEKKKLQEKLTENKDKSGRVGRKFGNPKPKTNVEKIKKTFGTLSVRAGIDNNPNPTYADKIAGAKMKKKNKKR